MPNDVSERWEKQMDVKKSNLYQILQAFKRGFISYVLVNLVFITGYGQESEPKNISEAIGKPVEMPQAAVYVPSKFLQLSYKDIYTQKAVPQPETKKQGEPEVQASEQRPELAEKVVKEPPRLTSRTWNIGTEDDKPEIVQRFDEAGQEVERSYDFNSDGIIDKAVKFSANKGR